MSEQAFLDYISDIDSYSSILEEDIDQFITYVNNNLLLTF